MKKLFAITVAIILFFSFNLKANTTQNWYNNIYVGGGLGWSPFGVDIKPKEGSKSRLFDLKMNTNLFVGYDFSKYFSLQLDFMSSSEDRLVDRGYDVANNVRLQADFDAADVSVTSVFKYPFMEKHAPFLSLGLGATVISEDRNIGVGNTDNEFSGLSVTVGLGYEYLMTSNHSFGVKWLRTYVPSYDYKQEFETQLGVDSTQTLSSAGSFNYSNVNLYYKYSF